MQMGATTKYFASRWLIALLGMAGINSRKTSARGDRQTAGDHNAVVCRGGGKTRTHTRAADEPAEGGCAAQADALASARIWSGWHRGAEGAGEKGGIAMRKGERG